MNPRVNSPVNSSSGGVHGTCRTDVSSHEAAAPGSQGLPEPRPFHLAGAGDREHLDPSTHLRHYQFNRMSHNLIRLLGEHLETNELRVSGSLNRHARNALRETLDQIRMEDRVSRIRARVRSPNQQACREGWEASLDDVAALPVEERSVPLRELASCLNWVPGNCTEMGALALQLAQGLPDDDRLFIEEAVTRAITPR